MRQSHLRGWGKAFGQRTIVHIDMDAFFAQIEMTDNPEYRGKALVVGGVRDGERGVVSTCSYEARRYGIHSAMPIKQAVKLCPHAIFIPTRMARYTEVSRHIREILASVSPVVEPLSIDEAFLDMTGCEHFYENPVDLGIQIKQRIKEQTGLTSSLGIAPNKFLAKLASDQKKPDGLMTVTESQVDTFLPTLPVEAIWGVGPKTAAKLHAIGIRTVGHVRARSLESLRSALGDRHGNHVYALAFGRDERRVQPDTEAKSIGRETTFEVDLCGREQMRSHLAKLVAHVGWRLRRKGLHARTVTVKVRFPDFQTHTKSKTVGGSFCDDDTIFREAAMLLDEFNLRNPIRLLGVYVSHFQDHVQGSLFSETTDRLTEVLDTLNNRLGDRMIKRGREF